MFSHTLHSMHTCAVVDYFHHPYPPPPPLSPSLSLSVSLSLSPLQRPLHCSLGDASGQSFNEQMSSSLLSLPACPPCSSCFFHDPSSPLPGPSHRKLIGYRVLNGDLSDGLGHGSHVAGSAVFISFILLLFLLLLPPFLVPILPLSLQWHGSLRPSLRH